MPIGVSLSLPARIPKRHELMFMKFFREASDWILMAIRFTTRMQKFFEGQIVFRQFYSPGGSTGDQTCKKFCYCRVGPLWRTEPDLSE